MKEYTLEQALRKLQQNGGRIKAKNSSDDWWFNSKQVFGELQHLNAYDVLKTWVWEPENKSAFQRWFGDEGIDNYDTFEICASKGWNAALDAVFKLGPLNKCDAFLLRIKDLEKLKEL